MTSKENLCGQETGLEGVDVVEKPQDRKGVCAEAQEGICAGPGWEDFTPQYARHRERGQVC